MNSPALQNEKLPSSREKIGISNIIAIRQDLVLNGKIVNSLSGFAVEFVIDPSDTRVSHLWNNIYTNPSENKFKSSRKNNAIRRKRFDSLRTILINKLNLGNNYPLLVIVQDRSVPSEYCISHSNLEGYNLTLNFKNSGDFIKSIIENKDKILDWVTKFEYDEYGRKVGSVTNGDKRKSA